MGAIRTFLSISLLAAALSGATGSPNSTAPKPAAAKAKPAATPSVPEVPSFRRDVMPVFFRAGCNQGTCHGSARGKDGFMLSLFGYDPKGDYYRITQEFVGRRINVAVPDQSLLLLKAQGKVPHTGGRLFAKDSVYYQILQRWIEAGAPDDDKAVPVPVEITLAPDHLVFKAPLAAQKLKPTQQMKVTARYSDGTLRDVTDFALFSVNNPSVGNINKTGLLSVGGKGDGFVFARFNRFTIGSEIIVLPASTTGAAAYRWTNPPANNEFDRIVYDRLQKLRLLPSQLCDDETFLRRATLDLAGTLPSVAEYRAFLADTSADKRARLVDRLIASDGFTDLWTDLWTEMLRVKGGGFAPTGTDVKAAAAYRDWIHDQIARNRPLNEFVADQITGTGSNLTDGPANLYTMLVHSTKFTPKAFASDFSQVFLGLRIQCAECHNHPFDRWTQDDYYGWVSFFNGIKRKQGVEPREFYIYNDPAAEPAKHLVDNRPMPATVLGGEAPVPKGVDPRQALAEWLTSPKNELFTHNLANRIWAQYMGRGLVEPVDDMRISNPPANKALLDALAAHLASNGFNLRALVREICTSRVYQLSAKPNATNADDTRQSSRAQLRRLRADVLLDAIVKATDGDRAFNLFPKGTKAIEHYPRTTGDTTGNTFTDAFFHTFGRSDRSTVAASDTRLEPTLSQTLHFIAGDTLQDQIARGKVVPKLLAAKQTPDAIIEELYIRALSRKPDAEERKALLALAQQDPTNRKTYEDIFWSLLDSTEFLFNH
jgi:hypothetical protein